MKNIKSVLFVVFALLVSAVVHAEADCSIHKSPSDQNDCYKFQVPGASSWFTKISESLYQDYQDLGLTDAESVSQELLQGSMD